MSKTDEAIRIKAIAVLDAAEVGVGALSNIFRELATGVPIDPQRAENLAAQCAELQKTIAELQDNERQRAQLESEKSALSGQLEARKLVERAKGILQREMKIGEEEAYRTMQRQSQQMRKSMKEISESVILNDELKRNSG